MREPQARDAAHREFGNVTAIAEEARDAWRWQWIEQAGQDVRYALRSMRKRPAFAAVAVWSIALGSGAAVALFAVLDSTLLRPLPVLDPAHLVESHGGSYPLYQRFRELHQVFSDVAAASLLDRSNVTTSSAGEQSVDHGLVRVELVSGNYFSLLGAKAAAGRTHTTHDDRVPGRHPIAVISDGYWRRRFGSAPDVLKRTVALNGTTYSVIGVAPRQFPGETTGRPVDIWVPMMMQSQVMLEMPGLLEQNNGWVWVVAGAFATRAEADTYFDEMRATGHPLGVDISRQQAATGHGAARCRLRVPAGA